MARQGWQRRRGAIGHPDLVRVQRQRNHGVVADQRGEFDDAGRAIGGEDALVGRVAGMMAPQQFGARSRGSSARPARRKCGRRAAASRSTGPTVPPSRASASCENHSNWQSQWRPVSRMTNSRSRGGKLELKRRTRPRSDHFSARSGRCMAAASGPTGGERRGPDIIGVIDPALRVGHAGFRYQRNAGHGFPPLRCGSETVWHDGRIKSGHDGRRPGLRSGVMNDADGDRTGGGPGGCGTR